jgi:hypothetical protein
MAEMAEYLGWQKEPQCGVTTVLNCSANCLHPEPSGIERADLGWHVCISSARYFCEVASDDPLQLVSDQFMFKL